MADWHYQWPSDIVKVQIEGDPVRAKELWGEANKLLCQLKNIMKLGNIQQYKMERVFNDGSVIVARSFFGQDVVSILTPEPQPEEFAVPPAVPVMVTFWATEKKIFFALPEGFMSFYIDISPVMNETDHFWYFAVVEDDPVFSALLFLRPEEESWYVLKFKVNLKTIRREPETEDDTTWKITVEDPWEHTIRTYYRCTFEYAIDGPISRFVNYGEEGQIGVPVFQASMVHPECPSRGYYDLHHDLMVWQTSPLCAAYIFESEHVYLPIDGLLHFEGSVEGDGQIVCWNWGGPGETITPFTYKYSAWSNPVQIEYNRVSDDPRAAFEPIGFTVTTNKGEVASLSWSIFANFNAWYKAKWVRHYGFQMESQAENYTHNLTDWGTCDYSIPFCLSIDSSGRYALHDPYEKLGETREVILDWAYDYGGSRWQIIVLEGPEGPYEYWTFATIGIVSIGGLTWGASESGIYYVDKCKAMLPAYDAFPLHYRKRLDAWLVSFPDFYKALFHPFGTWSVEQYELYFSIRNLDGRTHAVYPTGTRWQTQGIDAYTGGTSRHQGGGTRSRAMCRQFVAADPPIEYNIYRNQSYYLLKGTVAGPEDQVPGTPERASKELLIAQEAYQLEKTPTCDTTVKRPIYTSPLMGFGNAWGIRLEGKLEGFEPLIGHSVFSRLTFDSPRYSILSDFGVIDGRELVEEQ